MRVNTQARVLSNRVLQNPFQCRRKGRGVCGDSQHVGVHDASNEGHEDKPVGEHDRNFLHNIQQ